MEERVFDYRDLEIFTNFFDHENKIGEGGYGEVYRGMVPTDNRYKLPYRKIAVKHIKNFDEKKLQQLDNEICWFRRFNHLGIVEYLGRAESDNSRCIVLKLETRGNLADNIEDLNWAETLSILRQVASAISYVHSIDEGVVLGDVKLQNILLDEDMKPKLCDFGSTRTEGSKLAPCTPGIVDMVALRRGDARRGDDVHCFGVVIFQLLMKSRRALVEIGDGTDENGNRITNRIRFLAEEKLKTEPHVVHSRLIESGSRSGCSPEDAKRITDLAMDLTWAPEPESPPISCQNTMNKLAEMALGVEGDFSSFEEELETEDEIVLVQAETDEGGTSSVPIVRPTIEEVMSILNTLKPPVEPPRRMGLEMKKYVKASKKAIGKVGTKIRNKYVKVVRYMKDGKVMKILKKKMKKKNL